MIDWTNPNPWDLSSMRRAKSISALSSALLLGFAAGNMPAYADQADITRAEGELRQYSRDKDLSVRYANQLYYLAGLYRENGMRSKADATFQKFLTLWRKKPHAESEPSLLLGWANSLTVERHVFSYPNGTSQEQKERDQARDHAEHQQDLLRAAKIADDALAMAGRMEPTSQGKIDVIFSAISVYESTGNKAKKQRLISELDKTLASQEQNPNLTAKQLKEVATHLGALSELFAPMPFWRQSMNQPPVRMVSNQVSDHSYSVSQQNFSAAEKYRLRAMALYDRLPTKDGDRIFAQRNLAAWYKLHGQTDKYNRQLCKLGALLGSNDHNVLFPPPAPCPGCGRG